MAAAGIAAAAGMIAADATGVHSEAVIVAAITALAAIAVAVVPLLTLMIRQHRDVSKRIQTVHVLVNSQRTEAANYTNILIATLKAAGIVVPQNPNPPPDQQPGTHNLPT